MGISDLSVAVAGLSAALPPAILPTTPSGVLVLGDFVFRDYEIPEKITWGDQQKTHLFSYPGGLRSVEALGPEPMPITWAGRFQGAAATGRVRRLDTVCRLGKPLPLTWGALSFLVLVTKFTVNQERNWQCLYTIECLVVAAPIGLPSGLSLTDAAGAVVGDAAAAVGLGGLINNAGLTSALSAVQQAASTVQDTAVQAAGVAAGALGQPLGQLQSALGTASALAGTVAAASDGQIQAAAAGLAGVVPGAMGNSNATALLSTLSALQQASASRMVQGLVGRMNKNTDEVTS